MKEINKEAFPGIMFYRIDTSSMEDELSRAKANIHNLSHTNYETALARKDTERQIHNVRRKIDRLIGASVNRSKREARELREAEIRINDTWQQVLDSNKALPTKLRHSHTR